MDATVATRSSSPSSITGPTAEKERRIASAATILKKIGDETDSRKFTSLIHEWRDDCGSGDQEETLYYRLVRQATDYVKSWRFLDAVYVPRTDSFLNRTSYLWVLKSKCACASLSFYYTYCTIFISVLFSSLKIAICYSIKLDLHAAFASLVMHAVIIARSYFTSSNYRLWALNCMI